MRRSERGGAAIGVILAIAIGAIGVVGAYLAQNELTRNTAELARVQGPALDAQKQRITDATKRAEELSELAGWPKTAPTEADLDGMFDDILKFRVQELDKKQADIGLDKLASWSTDNPENIHAIQDLFQGKFGDTDDSDKRFRDGSTTLERLLLVSDTRLGLLQGTLQRSLNELEAGTVSVTAAQTRQTDILAAKDKEINALQHGDEAAKRDGVDQLQKTLSTVTDNYEQATTRKKQQVEAVKTEQTNRKREYEDATNKLMGEISRTIQALEEIQRKEAVVRDITKAQGHVVNPQADGLTCYINLTDKDGIYPGQRFRVFTKGFGGAKVWKGEIEVKRILPDASLCNVLARYDRSNPIIEGDLLYNALYNRGKTVAVVMLGDFDGAGIAKDEFIRRVKAHGGRIDEKITWDTDYVVTGKDPDTGSALYKEGALLGVPFVPVQQVLPYLGH